MKVAILGSGNGALAMAFEWARAGHDIYMFDFAQFDKQIKAINAAGGIYALLRHRRRTPRHGKRELKQNKKNKSRQTNCRLFVI